MLVNIPNSELLKSIHRANVCTGTQCFASNEDAGFGRLVTPAVASNDWLVALSFFMLASLAVRRNVRYLSSSK